MATLGPIKEELRMRMMDLTGNLCEYCGTHGTELHHKPYRSQPGSRNDVNHLLALCRKHHQMAHRIRNAGEQFQYEEFENWYDQLPKKLMGIR